MLVARQELFDALGIPDTFKAGDSLPFETADGDIRAWVGWSDEGQLEVSITNSVFGDGDEALLGLSGQYDEDSDEFDVRSFDHRDEASDPDDPFAVAVSFRSIVAQFDQAA